MVRLEFQVEQMKEERQQWRNALANMRTEVRMQMTTMEGELRKNTSMLNRLNGKLTFQGVLLKTCIWAVWFRHWIQWYYIKIKNYIKIKKSYTGSTVHSAA